MACSVSASAKPSKSPGTAVESPQEVCSGARHSCQPKWRSHSTSALTKEPLLAISVVHLPCLPHTLHHFLNTFISVQLVLVASCISAWHWDPESRGKPSPCQKLLFRHEHHCQLGLVPQGEAGMSVHWVSPKALMQKQNAALCLLIFKEPRPKDVTSSHQGTPVCHFVEYTFVS